MKPINCLVTATVAVALAVPVQAQVDCANWNTRDFFRQNELPFKIPPCLPCLPFIKISSKVAIQWVIFAVPASEMNLAAVRANFGVQTVDQLKKIHS